MQKLIGLVNLIKRTFVCVTGRLIYKGGDGEKLLPVSARYHTAVVGRGNERNIEVQPLDLVANHDDPGIKGIIESGNLPHEMNWLRL